MGGRTSAGCRVSLILLKMKGRRVERSKSLTKKVKSTISFFLHSHFLSLMDMWYDVCVMCVFFNLKDIMNSEKSYDSLPNFTAADCEFLLFQSLSLPRGCV